MSKLICVTFLLIFCVCNSQIDLQCNGRDLHAVYISNYFGQIYRIENVDTVPSDPILVTTIPQVQGFGISINANLNNPSDPETMYYVSANSIFYYYWNGSNWTNTNHSSGGFGAKNPGGTSNYIFNLNGLQNSITRYDGTGNATLLLSNLQTFNRAFYDIATDNIGNFYLFYKLQQEIKMFNPDGVLLNTFIATGDIGTDISEGGAGFAIIGNKLYAVTNNELYEGTVNGNTINFVGIKTMNFISADMAACPQAGRPLGLIYPVTITEIGNPCNGSVTLTSQVEGTSEDYSFQWFVDDYAIEGATSTSLQLNSAAQSGFYSLTVTQPAGNSTSNILSVQLSDTINFTLIDRCVGSKYIIEAISKQDLDENNLVFEWQDSNGNIIGNNPQFLDLSQAVNSSIDIEIFPRLYSLTITDILTGCKYFQSVEILSIFCDIPKGISPNGDNKNDNFDLAGFNVKKLEIFNRYGTKIYSKENYIDEWNGKSDSGNELPDGVYYYHIVLQTGNIKTGWVYLINEY